MSLFKKVPTCKGCDTSDYVKADTTNKKGMYWCGRCGHWFKKS